jgi:hypothetical protein
MYVQQMKIIHAHMYIDKSHAKVHIQFVDVVSSDTCDEDWKKCDDARSISMMNTASLDWFRSSHGVIAQRPVFTVLCYEIRCPR